MLVITNSYIVITLHYRSLPIAADTELQPTGTHVPRCSYMLKNYKNCICPTGFPAQILGNDLPCQTVTNLLAFCIAMNGCKLYHKYQ